MRKRGLKLLKRNFTCRWGEIDLVMADGEATVFVEVRYRGVGSRVSGVESVNVPKQLKLSRAAGIFLARNPRLAHGPCRFDIVAVDEINGRNRFSWIRDAFQAGPD